MLGITRAPKHDDLASLEAALPASGFATRRPEIDPDAVFGEGGGVVGVEEGVHAAAADAHGAADMVVEEGGDGEIGEEGEGGPEEGGEEAAEEGRVVRGRGRFGKWRGGCSWGWGRFDRTGREAAKTRNGLGSSEERA